MSDDKWEFNWDWVKPNIRHIIVPEKVRLERQEICKNCDRLNKIQVCKVCGCFMPLKTLLKDEECPKGKWGPWV